MMVSNGEPSVGGVNYSTLWQQVEAITMNWVDKTGTIVAVGSYARGSAPTFNRSSFKSY
jgi:hypothetical protein